MIDTTKLDRYIAEDRIIRNAWVGTDAQGRETVCLLAALSPEAAAERCQFACPADVMPPWLAALTVWLDDSPSDAAWPSVIRRYADVIAPFVALPPDEIERAHWQIRAACVREAMRHTSYAEVLAVCERVASLCDARGRGKAVLYNEMMAAARSAEQAAWSAARSEARAAEEAAWSAVWGAARAADDAALAAVRSAEEAGAARAASDRLADTFLSVLEQAVAKSRGAS